MSARTGIEWTEATWNPWMGCTKVSPGCAHCYMFREQRQYGRDPEVVVRSKTKFSEPLRWKEPRVIFTCSWSDWFHEDADQWRDEAWDIIRRTPQHTYQILTKRPERIRLHLPPDWCDGYPNVWLGTSIENQRWAERAVGLLNVSAAVLFVSAEPLLGPLDLTRIQLPKRESGWVVEVNPATEVNALAGTYITKLGIEYRTKRRISWVIAGGESGPEYRPMDVEWVRSLRDQCERHRVAFFLKQLGGWPDKRGGLKAVVDGARFMGMPARAGAA